MQYFFLFLNRSVCMLACCILANCSSIRTQQIESIQKIDRPISLKEKKPQISSVPIKTEHNSESEKSIIERSNLRCWTFNERLDEYVLRPVARVWMHPSIRWLTERIYQFFFNLQEPVSALHRVLEGSWHQAFLHFSRFLINSTLGIGGLWDVAVYSDPAFAVDGQRRLGDSLGSYGLPLGTYFMLPVYGAASLRQDILGFPEVFYNPVYYLFGGWISALAWSVKAIELRGDWLKQSPFFPKGSQGYYQFKSAYIQRRAFVAKDGKDKNSGEEKVDSTLFESQWFDPAAIDELSEVTESNDVSYS